LEFSYVGRIDVGVKILLCGAQGQLGGEIVRALPGVVALNRSQLDLASPRMSEVFEQICPDLVINAAAYTAVDQAEQDREQALAINRDGPARLAEQCARSGSPLLHFSTDYVFDGNLERPYHEEDACHPCSVYGASKLAGEEAIRAVLQQHWIVRVSWLFGAARNNFVKTILRLAQERDELRVVHDQRGGPTWTRHLAEVVGQFCALRPDWGTYHYADGPTVSWFEFAGEILTAARACGLPVKARLVPIPTQEYPTPARRPANSQFDCSKILSALGCAQQDWRPGLLSTVRELNP
jgi:dTDP-4-dehydrorhamnose reductase